MLLITSWRRSPHRVTRSWRHVPVLRPGGRHETDDEVERRRNELRARPGNAQARALRIAWQGRPGVVHVCIPEDVLNTEFDTPGAPDPAPERYRRQAPPRTRSGPGASRRRLARERRPADDPRGHRCAALERVDRAVRTRRTVARTGHHELGRARRGRRTLPRRCSHGPMSSLPIACATTPTSCSRWAPVLARPIGGQTAVTGVPPRNNRWSKSMSTSRCSPSTSRSTSRSSPTLGHSSPHCSANSLSATCRTEPCNERTSCASTQRCAWMPGRNSTRPGPRWVRRCTRHTSRRSVRRSSMTTRCW